MRLVILIQFACALMMTGIIWLVQIVHYPLFAFVGEKDYAKFHLAHMNWISFVVAPLMIIEAIAAILLLFYPPENLDRRLLWLGVLLVVIVWASTFLLQVPLHEKLARGFSSDTHRLLVGTNWIRTAGWTLRSALVLWLTWQMLK